MFIVMLLKNFLFPKTILLTETLIRHPQVEDFDKYILLGLEKKHDNKKTCLKTMSTSIIGMRLANL